MKIRLAVARLSTHPINLTFGSTVFPAFLNPKMKRVEGRNGTTNHARRSVAKTPAPSQDPRSGYFLTTNLTT